MHTHVYVKSEIIYADLRRIRADNNQSTLFFKYIRLNTIFESNN